MAQAVTLNYLTNGKALDDRGLTVAAWESFLADVAHDPELLPITKRLVQQQGFVTAADVRAAVLAERARAERSARWQRIDAPELERQAVGDLPPIASYDDFLAQCKAKVLAAHGPLRKALAQVVVPRPDEDYFRALEAKVLPPGPPLAEPAPDPEPPATLELTTGSPNGKDPGLAVVEPLERHRAQLEPLMRQLDLVATAGRRLFPRGLDRAMRCLANPIDDEEAG